MKIIRSKIKPGVYSESFNVYGYNEKGAKCVFSIYYNQAKTYKEAKEFWQKTWGKRCKAIYLTRAEPFSSYLSNAC